MSEVVLYKASFVVEGGTHPGTIMNLSARPELGAEVTFDGRIFQVTEVEELMPPIGSFGFIHVACIYLRDADES